MNIEDSEDGSVRSEVFESNEENRAEVLMNKSYNSTKSHFFFSCASDEAPLNRILEIVCEAVKNREIALKELHLPVPMKKLYALCVTKIYGIPMQQKLKSATHYYTHCIMGLSKLE